MPAIAVARATPPFDDSVLDEAWPAIRSLLPEVEAVESEEEDEEPVIVEVIMVVSLAEPVIVAEVLSVDMEMDEAIDDIESELDSVADAVAEPSNDVSFYCLVRLLVIQTR